jgi:hypothetical protein
MMMLNDNAEEAQKNWLGWPEVQGYYQSPSRLLGENKVEVSS